ncbi:hypothetical protein [Bacillus nitratireducens]|uniref:hypothetical protein n=1 Tax=Bacillus nitratireducens TaxID=2026193 RepID=UPI000B441060|nr:hypothetical protein [Bacillus nitratireducens]PFJ56925.1 hypothetical protein COI99_01060 [Bacillus cereus]PFJ95338.1 hypothetical protein COI97_22590 [Bacillus cereus]PGM68744.1 hypothetical protein CN957_32455 [Bacillus cereus]
MYTKLTNSYKLVSFNVVVVTTYKGCHTLTTKLTNLCYLKTDELKALACRLKGNKCFFRLSIEMRYNKEKVNILLD